MLNRFTIIIMRHSYRVAGFLVLSGILFLASCAGTRKTAATAHTDSLDIYLLIGQSNMAGRAPLGPAEKDTIPGVYLFTGTGWEPAANPLNKYSTVRKSLAMQQLGPGYSFARELAACTGHRIGLVVNARGGTAIEWWEKGYTGPNDFNLYEEAVAQMKKAAPYGRLKGIIWHQGEGNQGRPEQYMPLLKQLVSDLRSDLRTNAYFVAGELGQWHSGTKKINQVISSISSEIEHADYVTTDGLIPLHGDSTNPHFDEHSQLILGQRYADKVLEHIYRMRPCKK
jgi:hypothetical protein